MSTAAEYGFRPEASRDALQARLREVTDEIAPDLLGKTADEARHHDGGVRK